jgi:signal transduction histidine kinase
MLWQVRSTEWWAKTSMDALQLLALQVWSDTSSEGLLVTDPAGTIWLINSRLREWFHLPTIPPTIESLLRYTDSTMPELGSLAAIADHAGEVHWGNVRIQRYPPQRLVWQQVPLFEGDSVAGSLVIFRDATTQGQLELAKQSFLSMISHDLRTPLSTILGFAELLYNNRGELSQEEQSEFLEHIIKNATELSRYAQIALDIMYLEADMQDFEVETVFLDRFVRHWLSDAKHRLSAEQIMYHDGAPNGPMAYVSTAALHRILYILVEFALVESPLDAAVDIRLTYDESQAHILVDHRAPGLTAEDAGALFRLMHPRDLSEAGRPQLHRMQLYVANLLAERQRGYLTLRCQDDARYEFDLAVPLAFPSVA